MINDSSPERRNLMVTSILFIVFFCGQGRIEGKDIKFPMINVVFENPMFLVAIVWVMFFWFVYRYWLTFKNKFKGEYHEERNKGLEKNRNILKYVFKKTNLQRIDCYKNKPEIKEGEECFKSSSFTVKPDGYYIVLQKRIWKNGSWNSNGTQYVDFKGGNGRFVLTRFHLYVALSNPSFTSYIIPYILAATALVAGIKPMYVLITSCFFNV